ncbi:MAG: D-2-hydroxyacid dehydrogenase [Polyangiaceae bacterium]
MPRIVVLDGYTTNPGDNPWDALAELAELEVYERTPRELVAERVRGASVLLTNKTVLDAAAIAAAPELKGICVLATGYNVVDVAAASARGVAVCNVPAYSTPSVVEHTFALLFELVRRVGEHDQAVHAGEWVSSQDFTFWKSPQRELSGRCFGVVGYGEIGRGVARVAAALGMRVLATPSRRLAPEAGVEVCELGELARRADVLSLHCPLTPDTAEVVRWSLLSEMRREALIINTARGGLVRAADLARALDEGIIAGAALDVLSQEPPRADDPLLRAKNCIITPHLAWTSVEARRRLLSVSVENVRQILAGKPQNRVSAG